MRTETNRFQIGDRTRPTQTEDSKLKTQVEQRPLQECLSRHWLASAVAAWRRTCIFPIKAAPLRDRKEDIPILAAHFIDLVVRELKGKRPRLTDAGVKALQDYDWPGNVRELRNVIERTAILAQGGALVFDLPVTLDRPNSAMLEDERKGEPEYFTEAEIRRLERENILAVLCKTGWKIKGVDGAAKLLGVKPTTLVSRVEKLGLKRPRR